MIADTWGRLDPRLRKALFLAAAVLVVGSFLKYALIGPRMAGYIGGDFGLFYDSAKKVAAGESPYPEVILNAGAEGATGEAWGGYIYPPLFARVLAPFTVLSVANAKLAYWLICVFLYFGLLYPRLKDGVSGRLGQAVELTILFGWGPTIETLRLGQSNFVPLFLMIFAWRMALASEGSRDRRRNLACQLAAGFLMGIASTVKLTPLLILPALLVTFRFRMAAGFIAGGLASLLISGPTISWQYITKVFPSMSDFPSLRYCPSIHVLVTRTFDRMAETEGWASEYLAQAPWIGVGVSGAVYASFLVFLYFRRLRFSNGDLILVGCYLPPLFAGALFHHYTLAIPPVILAVRRALNALAGSRDLPYKGQRSGRVGARLTILALVLLPTFLYWYPSKVYCAAVGILTTFSHSTQVVIGNLLALLLILPFFMRANPGDEDGGGMEATAKKD